MPHAESLLIATTNPGKLKELASLLSGCPFHLVSLAQAGISDDVPETGSTLEQNATLKAATYARVSGIPTLADDSGLEVDALGGGPGPLSARFAGEGAGDDQRIAYLLQRLEGVPDGERNARFRSVIAVAWPGETVELHAGECYGSITRAPRGSNGFGYDPVFLLPELGRTMAELSTEEKNRLSHRSKAARKAVTALQQRADRSAVRGSAESLP
jgi:XTP/dITP diphosphohydrolase